MGVALRTPNSEAVTPSGEKMTSRAPTQGRGQEAQPQGDAELPKGSLRGAHQARGAPQAPRADVLRQADPREGPDRQALAPVQVHLQQLHQGGRGPAVQEDLSGVQELSRQQQRPQRGLRRASSSSSSFRSLSPVTKSSNSFSKILFMTKNKIQQTDHVIESILIQKSLIMPPQ